MMRVKEIPTAKSIRSMCLLSINPWTHLTNSHSLPPLQLINYHKLFNLISYFSFKLILAIDSKNQKSIVQELELQRTFTAEHQNWPPYVYYYLIYCKLQCNACTKAHKISWDI